MVMYILPLFASIMITDIWNLVLPDIFGLPEITKIQTYELFVFIITSMFIFIIPWRIFNSVLFDQD